MKYVHSLPIMIKYGLDKILAVMGLLILSLPMCLIAGLVRLDGGPVFYSQWRIGQDGRSFRMLKFRSMVVGADEILENLLEACEQTQLAWDENKKIMNDQRITTIGYWLRRSSLDELPQLWNVLVGDMSLVGPRPILPNEIEDWGGYFQFYRQVKPGITGLWQVSGRSSLTYQERVEIDASYVQNWTFWLDVKILMRTIVVVLLAKGAY